MVVERRDGDQRERNLEVGTSWFQRQEDWAARRPTTAPTTGSGSRSIWTRPEVGDLTRPPDEPDSRERRLRRAAEPIDRRARRRSRSPTSSRRGGGHLPRRPDRRPGAGPGELLPELAGDGAEGPYRVAPNLMVVVPTANEVRLTTAATPPTCSSTCSRWPGWSCWCSSACGATNGSTILMRPARSRWRRTTRFPFSRPGYTEGDAEFDAPPPTGLPVTEQPPNRSPVDAESSPWAPDPPLA